ncbi:MAG: NAD-binding protein, partial [Nitrosopumilus sp.]|nr:NAD-binding protein [Nitrosopumilus sp.]
PKIFLEIINSTYFKTGMSENKAFRMVEGKFEATFTLENLHKDISTIIETAESHGIQLPMIKKAKELYQNAIEQGYGKMDYTGILSYLKKINES